MPDERPRIDRSDWKRYADRLANAERLGENVGPDAPSLFEAKDGWRADHYEIDLAPEPPGDPLANGPFASAVRILRAYDFPDPKLITGIYVGDRPFEERSLMLLKARFLFFRFWFAVRLTDIRDDIVEGDEGPTRVWGYGYRTLDGHFEMGEILFTVRKTLSSGAVSFHIDAVSKPDRIRNPFYRIGFKLFGRSLQKRFARTSLERMQRFVREEAGGVADHPRETVPVEEMRTSE